MDLALSTTVHDTFDRTVERTRAALAEQGFGILTEIDLKATLKSKIGADIEDYLILGACNPPLAHRAVTADRQFGLLLPCNVVIRAAGDDSILVEAMNPLLLDELTGTPELRPVAEEAAAKLSAAIDQLANTPIL